MEPGDPTYRTVGWKPGGHERRVAHMSEKVAAVGEKAQAPVLPGGDEAVGDLVRVTSETRTLCSGSIEDAQIDPDRQRAAVLRS